ncbi:MAG: hypothetical protein IJV02_01950, partial [Candidatus Methanomethylophilaceae archaeon]|nr:hypothetical protein [Candidatus Methanomethylophilaceae archaeon]
MISYLVLEDGTVYEGDSFGYQAEAFGEVVFSTGMSGYQESLTDPSYNGQILVMTFPTIGNYGVNDEYFQSSGIHCRALVVREYTERPSDSYKGKTIDEFLKDFKVPGISGVDTRDLVIRIREHDDIEDLTEVMEYSRFLSAVQKSYGILFPIVVSLNIFAGYLTDQVCIRWCRHLPQFLDSLFDFILVVDYGTFEG